MTRFRRFLKGDRKLLFFQFPDVLPIKLASGKQEEPMSVEESSNEQTATPEKVCPYTQLGAMPTRTTQPDLY